MYRQLSTNILSYPMHYNIAGEIGQKGHAGEYGSKGSKGTWGEKGER